MPSAVHLAQEVGARLGERAVLLGCVQAAWAPGVRSHDAICVAFGGIELARPNSRRLTMHVVWLKRDLRLDDHAPFAEVGRLCEAGGSMIALYVHEPSVWSAPDADASHLAFVDESLDELERAIESIGGRLVRRVGEVVDVLARPDPAGPIETSALFHSSAASPYEG